MYLFLPDEAEDGSACQGSCVATWPPYTIDDDPVAGDGVTATLTTFERRDTGELQVMANGWPLYYFVQDDTPGDATGQGISDIWWTVSPDGTALRERTTG